ncbi:MAG: PQQ-dependent sugar dehydrogenase, partial [Planctomycetaceae bacterium]
MAFTLILGFVWFLMAGEVARAAAPMAEATRIPLADLRVVGSPDPPLPYEVATVFTDLKVSTPVLLVADPLAIRNRVRSSPGEPFGAHQRFVIGQRYGRLATFSSSGTGKTTTLFLNLTPAEVLSLAFHPRYEENRHVFVLVVRSTPPIPGRRIQLLRFRVEQEPPESCDPASETVLLEWDTEGHTGGSLLFGPDGMLYVSVGDGSTGGDRQLSGQDISDLNASILRIDVDRQDAGKAYAIPSDNPFVNTPGARGEVWALGLRNPWRMHFDPAGQLWVGDVGEDRYESILIAEKGDNFGWSLFEGGHPYKPGQTQGPGRLKQPAIVHSHEEARSLIGGVTYQGDRLPELRGGYIYGDHVTGMIWAARQNPDGSVRTEKICDTGRMISSFARDAAGEIFFLDFNKATICTLVPTAPAPPP